MARYVKIPGWCAFKIPDEITTEEASSIPIAYTTAVQALIRVAHLKKGETILIHSGSGAVGQVCIVLAHEIGAEVFVITVAQPRGSFFTRPSTSPSHTSSSRRAECKDGIMCATNNEGVDVVVNF